MSFKAFEPTSALLSIFSFAPTEVLN